MSMARDKELADLLAAVEVLLRDKVASTSAGEARFATLMATSAIGMAKRALTLAPLLSSASAAVAALAPQPSPFPDPTQALTHLIREGLMDGDDALFQCLMVDAITRTAVTRPGILTKAEKHRARLED